jgi:hypothetical protein
VAGERSGREGRHRDQRAARAGGGKNVGLVGSASNVECRGDAEGKSAEGLTPTIKCHASDVLHRVQLRFGGVF